MHVIPVSKCNSAYREPNPNGQCGRSWVAEGGNLRPSLSIMIPNFWHISSEQQQARHSDVKVWWCWKNLAHSSCCWACYCLQSRTLTQCPHCPTHGGRALLNRQTLQPCVHTGQTCPFLPAELLKLNLQSHRDSTSLFPVKGRITLMTALLADSRGGTHLKTQLMTEIAVWLNILFLHIHCSAKSLPLALSSFIKCFPEEIFLISQINIYWSGFKNFKGLDVCY